MVESTAPGLSAAWRVRPLTFATKPYRGKALKTGDYNCYSLLHSLNKGDVKTTVMGMGRPFPS